MRVNQGCLICLFTCLATNLAFISHPSGCRARARGPRGRGVLGRPDEMRASRVSRAGPRSPHLWWQSSLVGTSDIKSQLQLQMVCVIYGNVTGKMKSKDAYLEFYMCADKYYYIKDTICTEYLRHWRTIYNCVLLRCVTIGNKTNSKYRSCSYN